jgi:hypothetical protein
MRLLRINEDDGSDDEVDINLSRLEIETLFMFVDMGIGDSEMRLKELCDNPTTLLAAGQLAKDIIGYRHMCDMLSMMLDIWETRDDPEETIGELV